MTQPEEVHSEFERRLLDQYRAAADEQPPPALDRAVLDNARRAAAATHPRGVRGPAPAFVADVNDAPRQRSDEARWGRPLALAAAVVLGIGIVVRYEMESPDLSPPQDKVAAAAASEAAAPPPAALPSAPAQDAPGAAAGKAAAAPAAAEPAPPVAGAKDSADVARPKAAPKAEQAAPKARPAAPAVAERHRAPEPRPQQRAAPAPARVDSVMRENLAREESDQKIRAQAAAELQKAESRAQPAGAVGDANAKLAGPPMPAATARAAAPATAPAGAALGGNLAQSQRRYSDANSSASAVAAPPPPPAMAPPPPPPPAPARAEIAADAAVAPRVPFYEGDPDLWARHIIELRRGGRNQSADADLRRLRARYPGFKLPAEALPPAPQ
ncbi:MAG TPA: hypothetical protein VH105_19640 [Burkholderiales bacterium]|jgi:hypothetical protein|nr:hypothetical protein [Burkholderiales bacterium]